MAILDGGLLGKSKGKVGNIVTGSDVKKQVTARAYQPNVANPRTTAQLLSRVVIAGASKLTGAYLAAIGNQLFQTIPANYPNARSYLVAAMRKGTTETVTSPTGTGFANTNLLPDATAFHTMGIRWSSGRLSTGNLAIDSFTAASQTSVTVNASFSSELLSGYDSVTDILEFVCINTTTGAVRQTNSINERQDGNTVVPVSLPPHQNGDYLVITAFFRKANQTPVFKEVSNGYTLMSGYITNGTGWGIRNLSGNNDIFG